MVTSMQVKFLSGLLAGLATSSMLRIFWSSRSVTCLDGLLDLRRGNPIIYLRYVNDGLYVTQSEQQTIKHIMPGLTGRTKQKNKKS